LTPPLSHDGEVSWITFGPRNEKQDAEYIVTAGAEGAARIWSFPRDLRPTEDLVLLTRVLSGHRVEGGGLELLAPREILEGWRSLRARYPEECSLAAADELGWRRGVLRRSERQGDWRGVLWHADRLLKSDPESIPAAERRFIQKRRARALAELGKWQASARAYGEVFEHDPGDYVAGYRSALLSLASKDETAYEGTCRRLLERSPDSDNWRHMLHTVYACTLAPDSIPDPEKVVELAKRVTAREMTNDTAGALGAALFRAGRLDAAIVQLNVARLYYPEGKRQLLGGTYQDHLFLALSYGACGLKKQASLLLEKAKTWIDEGHRTGRDRGGEEILWPERLRREILLEAAGASLAP
jgi:hypothetical protein